MKRTPLICPLLALALPALAHVAATTKLSVDYENAAFTNVLADISAKVEAATPEDPFGFLIRLDPSVTNDLPAITLRADERVALTAVQHGRALRWRAFSDDYPFTEESAQALARWFEEHGVRLGPDAP